MKAELELRWETDRVVLARHDQVVGSARWVGGKLSEREGALSPEEWRELEVRIRDSATEDVDKSFEHAYDSRGVDVTQIDRMLERTPAERLRWFDAARRSVAALSQDAR
ncbi:MAG: hypothetical protein KC776_07690 [Myxococcales bacterium]|nr:hypothetical protein [Myxococcales bacterium]MCB9583486.1 hypothetical protein [Polyangiaceae bacterium]